MKKLAFVAAAAASLTLPAAAIAQTAVATVNASATVEASLTAATTHQLKFGTLALGDNSTLNSSGGGQAALSGAATAGLGQINVAHNSNVSATATVPAVLTNSTTSATLAFAANCATATTSGGTGNALPSCTSFSLSAAAPGTVQNTYVLVGGTLTGSAAAGVGTFTGDLEFTFTATN